MSGYLGCCPSSELFPRKTQPIYLAVLRSRRLKILDQAYLKRGYILTVCALDSFHTPSTVSTKRFKLLSGGM
ncbi:UNVERIFIED_CONTAM: hypothetical protein Slati_0329400 [Sesamum latifolium]|uniref:Uncharacterized protein n=1 Tax=Sesamum latifolium TaxID=2727402 RepID=A0AAW2YF57_9LAMI